MKKHEIDRSYASPSSDADGFLSGIVDRNLRGRERKKGGKLDEAVELYKKNLEKNCNTPFPYWRLAIIYRERNLFNDKIKVLKRGIGNCVDLTPDSSHKRWLEKFRKRLEKAKAKKQRHEIKEKVREILKKHPELTAKPVCEELNLEYGKYNSLISKIRRDMELTK